MQDEHGMARMQELLSSYYGIQDKETQAQSRRNIDAPGFDPNTYVKVRSPSVVHVLAWYFLVVMMVTASSLTRLRRRCWRRRG